MKRSVAASTVFLLAFAATHAADLTLTDGRTFHDATIVSQTPRKVVIKHTNGLSGIEKTLLPTELSARYPLDEAAAREADRQTAEARARAEHFHRTEAERAFIIRLEREQTALHNAQVAALEASQRLAEAEAARIAAQRTEIVYEYVSFNRPSPYYVCTPRRADDCTPRWNEKPRNHFVHDNRSSHRDWNINLDRRIPNRSTRESVRGSSHQSAPQRSPQQTRLTDEERTPVRPTAAVARR